MGMEAHYRSRLNRNNSSMHAGVGRRGLPMALLLLCLVTLSSFFDHQSSSVVVLAVNLNIYGREKSEDDDDDLNVDPNMAQGENQYMFGAAVNQVENNQADKEDKGEDGGK